MIRWRGSSDFIDRTLRSVVWIKELMTMGGEGTFSHNHFLRGLRPELKVFTAFVILVSISLIHEVKIQCLISLGLFLIILVSGLSGEVTVRPPWLNPLRFYRRVLPLTLFFGLFLSLPASINLFVKGELAIRLLRLDSPKDFWIYHIPQEIGITYEGLNLTALLTLRVFNAITTTFLLITYTPFEEIIKALKRFRIPETFLMILLLSYRYIILFARVVEDFYLAKRARYMGRSDRDIIENWVAGRMHLLFRKTKHLSEEMNSAMKARGMGLR